ncbi:MAG: hypothetical protein OHK0053_10930 [Microscillaceae bacterium]
MNQKYAFTFLLMGLSLALLVLFQGFWLQKIYQETYSRLQKEANDIFQKTMFEMQDSLIQKSIASVKLEGLEKEDSLFIIPVPAIERFKMEGLPSAHFWQNRDRFRLRRKEFSIVIDSLRKNGLTKTSDSLYNQQVKIFIKTHDEKSEKEKEKILQHILRNRDMHRFIVQINSIDSLKLEAIRKNYQQALRNANLDLPFTLHRYASPKQIPTWKGIHTEPYESIPPQKIFYMAHIRDYHFYIFQKTWLYWAFSLFLIAITGGAFYLTWRALRQQQRLGELKNEFISNVTHELKTPVSTISVAVEALQNFNILEDPIRTQEYLEISKNELTRLSIMIDKILKTALFEKKGLILKRERIQMTELVGKILTSLKLLFEKHGAKVYFTQKGEHFKVEADATHLTNVIYNLIDNALKYSPESPEIHLHLQSDNQQLMLSVADKGIGIAPEYQKRIFENFFRVPTGNMHNAKGYGLGLGYVAKVIHQHSGKILLESAPGKGAKFQIFLPLEPEVS